MQTIALEQKMNFLSQCYFGAKQPGLENFLSRAYRDMNRTLRGIASRDLDGEIRSKANQMLTDDFLCLLAMAVADDISLRCKNFNRWHYELCEALICHYQTALKVQSTDPCNVRMTYGQAQKWINMTIKYCWVCGGTELQRLTPWFPVAHIPVDEVILTKAQEHGIDRPCKNWSTWDDYTGYLRYQNEIRSFAANQKQSPLELEFNWFME